MNMLDRLRLANKTELLVGIGFCMIGFSIGSLVIGNTLKNKVQLDSPQEVTQPESKPYLSELSPESVIPPVSKPQTTEIQQVPTQDLPPATAASPVDDFSDLSQEEKNCIIWKNAYPEAAYKLKQGDACY